MLNEEKIRIMIRLADYEKGDGNKDLHRMGYYKIDYIKMKVLQTILSVTLAYFFITLLFLLYRMEFIVNHILVLDYASIGVQFGILYFLFLVFFTLITIGLESLNYENSKKKVKRYYQDLNHLIAYYEEEKTS